MLKTALIAMISSNACGHYVLPSRLLKSELTPLLAFLFHQCHNTGIELNQALVTGTLLIMLSHIAKLLWVNDIFLSFQQGFHENLLTVT